jgi:MFS transporter, DHA2 family, multidrug resistance protein
MSPSTSNSSAATARSGADEALLPVKHRGLLMLGVMMVSICQFLDATIANVALPYMQTALGAGLDSVSWVLTSFIIATAIATPLTGWLSDRIGSRRLFLLATVMFLVTSALCGAATSLAQMVLFRALQGIAAAFIGPMTMTIMFDVNPPSRQAMAMSVFSMVVMVAPITGPFLGGVLTEYLSWRWIFYVNLPIGIPALAILWWLLPSRQIERRRLDLFGFAAIALALGALQLMLDRGQGEDWFNSWEIIIAAVLAMSGLWVFVVHSRGTREPLFRSALFSDINFMIAVCFMGVMGIAVVGLSAVLPMMFQTLYGYPVMEAGLMMAPRGVGVTISSLLAAALSRRMDPRILVATGFLIAAGGMWSMTGWTIEMGRQPIVIASFLQGLGIGLVVTPVNLLAFATLNPALRPEGSSLMSLFRNLGGSVGISVIVTMLARNQQVSHADVGSHVTADSIPAVDLPGLVDRAPGMGDAVIAAIEGEVSRQATMIAFLDNFYMLTWVMLIIAPLTFLLRKPAAAGATPNVPPE